MPSGPSNPGGEPALQKAAKWRQGRLTGGGHGEISSQSQSPRAPRSLSKQTPRVEVAGSLSFQFCLSPSPAHLIRGTSIISSSNPHELTVQGEREAASAGVHRVQAICWPRGPAASPRAAASQGRLCVHSCPVGSPPTLIPRRRLRLGHGIPQAVHPGQGGSGHEKGPAERGAAFLPSGHTGARPSLARPLAAGGLPRRQPSTCEGTAPGPPPAPQGQESSHRCLEAVKVLPGQRGGTIWVGGRAGTKASEGR